MGTSDQQESKKMHSALVVVLAATALTTGAELYSNNKVDLLRQPDLAIHYLSRENFDRMVAFQKGLIQNREDEEWPDWEEEEWEWEEEETPENSTLFHQGFDKVFFHLYTLENGIDSPKKVFVQNLTKQMLMDAGFKPSMKTKIASHGWQSDVNNFRPLAQAYLSNPETTDINILVLDWSWIASDWTYYGAAASVPLMGDAIGEILGKVMVKEVGVDPANIHCIGHSLGSHNVGHIGRKIAEAGGKGKVSRVTGLDPALPYFETAGPNDRILATDGELVDIIHTNSGYLSDGALSFVENLGHIDFFPNGGSVQPGCLSKCDGWGCTFNNLGDMFSSCSHSRAISLYLESAQASNNDNHAFKSYGCNDYEDFKTGTCSRTCSGDGDCYHMGEHLEFRPSSETTESSHAAYYLDTHADFPYTM